MRRLLLEIDRQQPVRRSRSAGARLQRAPPHRRVSLRAVGRCPRAQPRAKTITGCEAALIALGVRADGVRTILGLPIGDSESFATWDDFFKGLKARGLNGVLWVISDSHTGLVEAARKSFQNASSGPWI